MSDDVPAWPDDVYLAFDGGAFIGKTLKPCPCGNATFEVVERPNGSVWAECPVCCQKHGKRNGRLLARLDMVGKRLVPVKEAMGNS